MTTRMKDDVEVGGERPTGLIPLEEDTSVVRSQPVYPVFHRLLSALFYALCSTLIVLVNKLVLTSYRFPSFLVLGVGQMVFTIVLLAVLRAVGYITFPSPHPKIFKEVWPLPLLFLASIMFSLGSTKKLSLPMYVVLRRFANVFIMAAEYFILGQTASLYVQMTVYLMILGAFLAAVDDLTFDVEGYVFVFVTNICAALSGVFTKKKLNNNTVGTYGLMFYNSLFMVLPAMFITYLSGDIHKAMEYGHSGDSGFQVLFLLACVMGFLVALSSMLCTKFNSALTTSIVGVLKNVFVIYSGMIIVGDYVYSVVNFLGINLSVVTGLMYSYATFTTKSQSSSSSGTVKV